MHLFLVIFVVIGVFHCPARVMGRQITRAHRSIATRDIGGVADRVGQLMHHATGLGIEAPPWRQGEERRAEPGFDVPAGH